MDIPTLLMSYKKIMGGQTKGFVQANDLEKKINKKVTKCGTEYANDYTLQEKVNLLNFNDENIDEALENNAQKGEPGFDLTSVGTFPDVHKIDCVDSTKIYAQYFKTPAKETKNLIINQYKSKILAMIESNEVTVISGPTGCGKTTKIPQYILDAYAAKNEFCNIIVCQPRRIAAIAVAKRVCDERGWPLPSICGYKVGLIDMTCKDTRLTYVTVGVLLQMLLNKKNMNDYTHVILDEVHERDQETDFALLIVRQFSRWNSRNVKVILMSATADTEKFANYFEKAICGQFQPAPIVHIKEPNEFVINIHYLEELSYLGKLPVITLSDPCITDDHVMIGINLIKRLEILDSSPTDKKSILIFLPGIYEIEKFYNKLKAPEIYKYGNTEYKWQCIPLHSSVTLEEQAQAFISPPPGYRKIILATNIAESSITVPDVMFVIDYCLTKVLITDPETNFTCLQLCWASKDNLIQRAGRTGRVMSGRVYRMIYTDTFNELDDHCVPGMLRCPLERVVLQAKRLEIGPPKAVLALAMDPPDLRDIGRTILILKEAGGLLLTKDGHSCNEDGDLTFLGRLMASLPVDIHITKLIALGFVYNCLEQCIIMGSAMSLKSLFSTPFKAQLQSYNAKLDWANGSCSDAIAFLNVYEVWKENHSTGYFKRAHGPGELNWAKRHFIQLRTLKEVDILVDEIKMRMKQFGFEVPVNGPGLLWNEVEKSLVLKFVLAGAFYPNYFIRGARAGQVDEKEAVKTLCGRDPYKTVYLQNYPLNQPPDIYSHLICEKMSLIKENMKITYDCSKVFIEFQADDNLGEEDDTSMRCRLPGKISLPVYKAVKMRDAFKSFDIEMLPSEEAKKVAAKMKAQNLSDNQSAEGKNAENCMMFHSVLPGVDIDCIEINITYVENPNCFWATLKDIITHKNERDLFYWLNTPRADLHLLSVQPKVGDMLVAPYECENDVCLYRARVDEVRDSMVKVFFIDFGNSQYCSVNELRVYGPKLWAAVSKIPGQAFQCTLTNIQPSLIKNANGAWCPEAKKKFEQWIESSSLFGDIYSIVNGVISMILYMISQEGKSKRQIDINQALIDEGYAEACEETYLSRMNSEVRKNRQLNGVSLETYNSVQERKVWTKPKPSNLILKESKSITAHLRGPFSPLEMNIYSIIQGGASKLVRIAQTSVNSVLLDSNPQDSHERLIVAGHVGQSQSGNSLILCNTTIMPNIHGLAALIPLVFAPIIELRVNSTKMAYTGFLCGLGADEDGDSIFPERDMEVMFDCEFTYEDIIMVNRLRYFMANLMSFGFEGCVRSYPELISFQKNLKECFMSLLKQGRASIELEFPKKQFMWNLVQADVPLRNEDIFHQNRLSVFPPHRMVKLKPKEKEKERMKKHLAYLEEITLNSRYSPISRSKKPQNILCELCKINLTNVNLLGLHLKSESHLSKEEKFLAM